MIRNLITAVLAAIALNAFAAVDVNQASQAELETVKGIGPALSSKILDARKAATFKDWNDLADRVSGIGPGNAARLSQAGLTVAGQGFVAAAGDAPKASPKVARVAKADSPERKAARKGADAKNP